MKGQSGNASGSPHFHHSSLSPCIPPHLWSCCGSFSSTATISSSELTASHQGMQEHGKWYRLITTYVAITLEFDRGMKREGGGGAAN
ncbi:hypothetical protein BRADI_5g16525v3 [Brachypodium distachyon]|uniref:Uncharacterized protein n=1 Tax=Brachypodium distachyon TaxID=15368 RepID=A0A2K2CHN3_BRADI|nr:hypothetical protein BRADI_5g16525v3 [Brachypodium distachyon]